MALAILLAAAALLWIVITVIRSRGWEKSQSGNDTLIAHGSRITVFPQDGGWKFCIADPADETPPLFSGWYPDAAAAKRNAMLVVQGQSTDRELSRDRRERQAREDAPAILARAEQKLAEMEKAVKHLKRMKSHDYEKFERLIDRLNQARSYTQHAHHQLIDCDADPAIRDRAGEIPLKIIDLKANILTYQSGRGGGLPSKGEEARGTGADDDGTSARF